MALSELTDKAVLARSAVLAKKDLAALVDRLSAEYQVYGPKAKGEQVAFGPISSAEEMDLGYTITVLSPKKYLHRAMETLFKASRNTGEIDATISAEKQALFGVHPCDANAIRILDKVFNNKGYEDTYYNARRAGTFLVALNCTEVGENCFCASYGTGPGLEAGFDLLLTDLGDKYLVEIGSEAGDKVLKAVPTTPATSADLEAKQTKLSRTEEMMPKFIDTQGLPQIMDREIHNPYWAQLKEECLACGNCTMVCPSCFCYNVVDQLDLTLDNVERVRTWDSCLLLEFSEVHGGNFRKERDARIKQWMYHKLDYWVEQYGSFGCVGCGRCVAWCPKGIDVTEAAKKIRGGQEK